MSIENIYAAYAIELDLDLTSFVPNPTVSHTNGPKPYDFLAGGSTSGVCRGSYGPDEQNPRQPVDSPTSKYVKLNVLWYQCD